MILDRQRKYGSYEIDGVPSNFSDAPDGIKVSIHAFHTYSVLTSREQLGDYGHFTDSKEFCCEGNFFIDLELPSLMADITPRQHKISSMVRRKADNMNMVYDDLHKLLMLSLPSNNDLKSLLTSLSTRLTNRYLVTRVIQYSDGPGPCVCDIARPFVWYRNESASSASEERAGDEFRAETEVTKVNDVDEMEL